MRFTGEPARLGFELWMLYAALIAQGILILVLAVLFGPLPDGFRDEAAPGFPEVRISQIP